MGVPECVLSVKPTNKTEKESTGDDLAVGADLTRAGGHKAPGNCKEPEIPRWTATVIQQQIRRHLHEHL